MTQPAPEPAGYVLGPDVDLDAEDVRRADGSRLTADDVDELTREAVELYLR